MVRRVEACRNIFYNSDPSRSPAENGAPRPKPYARLVASLDRLVFGATFGAIDRSSVREVSGTDMLSHTGRVGKN